MKDQPYVDTSPKVSDEIRKTTCYMCACRCGINVHLKDGKVAYIEGNRDHPVNKGVLCAKGSAGIMQVTAPSRLRAPLKREWRTWLWSIRGNLLGRGAWHCDGLVGSTARKITRKAGVFHRT